MESEFRHYAFQPGMHKERKVIWVAFPKDERLLAFLRSKVKALHWSATQKCWYVADTANHRQLFSLPQTIIGKEALSSIHEANRPALQRLIEHLKLKGYSENTLRTYSIEFAQLLYLLQGYPVDELNPERLRSYFLYCKEKLKLSENGIHSRMNAIKFYFEQVLKREKMFFDIPRPKRKKQLAKTLNRTQIAHLFDATGNAKHKLLLQLCYGMGLRVSELVSLSLTDIDSEEMVVHIKNGKGKKDRIVALPSSVLEEMRAYYLSYCPQKYLFEGQPGMPYAVRSAQAVFKNAMRKAGIKKQVGIHGLRHSYATHLMEYCVDIAFIQKLLGHNDLKTTLAYTHVANKSLTSIKSPLDSLKK